MTKRLRRLLHLHPHDWTDWTWWSATSTVAERICRVCGKGQLREF